MSKVINIFRDKKYLILSIIVVLIIIILIISSCAKGGTGKGYAQIEDQMIKAAKKFYSDRSGRLPVNDGDKIQVSLSVLVGSKLIKEVKDPKNSNIICTGRVETTKVGEVYNYQAYLTCGDNYKTTLLSTVVMEQKATDKNKNGLYEVNGEYIFKGENLKNFVKFNNELWLILKIDNAGDFKLLKLKPTDESYTWDDRYNVEIEFDNGINDFNISRIKETLEDYYEKNIKDDAKAKIVAKEFCIGKRSEEGGITSDEECSIKKVMSLGLLHASEFYDASLDPDCKNFLEPQCENYNYLAQRGSVTWTITGSKKRTDRVYYLTKNIRATGAAGEKRIAPVIYINSDVVISQGEGTEANPYIIK